MKFPKFNSPLAALKSSVKTQIEGVRQTADNLREAKSLYDDYKNFDFENSDPTQFVNRLDKLVENSIDNDKTLNLIKMRDPEIYNKIIENREYIKETAKLSVEEQIRRAKEFYEQNQGLGSKVANEVIPEAKIEVSETIKPTVEPKVVETVETVKEELPKPIEIQKDIVPETTQVASTSSEVSKVIPDTSSVSIPEVAKNYNFFDFNKNGHISDDLLKVGLGVAGAAALGYGAHKLYKHFKNKKKDMSEKDYEEFDKYYMQKSRDLRDEIAHKVSQKYADDIFDSYLLNRYPTYDESLSKEQNYKNIDNRFKIYRRDALNKKFFTDKNDMSEWWIGPAAAATGLGIWAAKQIHDSKKYDDPFKFSIDATRKHNNKLLKPFNKHKSEIDEYYNSLGAGIDDDNGIPKYRFKTDNPLLEEVHVVDKYSVRKDKTAPFGVKFEVNKKLVPTMKESLKDQEKYNSIRDQGFKKFPWNPETEDSEVDEWVDKKFSNYLKKKYKVLPDTEDITREHYLGYLFKNVDKY